MKYYNLLYIMLEWWTYVHPQVSRYYMLYFWITWYINVGYIVTIVSIKTIFDSDGGSVRNLHRKKVQTYKGYTNRKLSWKYVISYNFRVRGSRWYQFSPEDGASRLPDNRSSTCALQQGIFIQSEFPNTMFVTLDFVDSIQLCTSLMPIMLFSPPLLDPI